MRSTGSTPAYEVVLDWAKIPADWDLIEVPGLAVDSKNRIFAFVMALGEVTDEWYATAAGAWRSRTLLSRRAEGGP